ncbi:type II toxin-antitoxin system RelE/ParE family toxin [soil metagenome]
MTRRTVEVAPQARRDIVEITQASRKAFGDAAALRYRDLVIAGIGALAEQPAQRAAKTHEGVRSSAWTYHLRLFRQTPPRIRKPRHLIVYTYDDEFLRVLRVLHDAMDLPRQLSNR